MQQLGLMISSINKTYLYIHNDVQSDSTDRVGMAQWLVFMCCGLTLWPGHAKDYHKIKNGTNCLLHYDKADVLTIVYLQHNMAGTSND